MSTANEKIVNISIAITDLAPLSQMDHYNNFARVMCKLWKTYNRSLYDIYKQRCYENGDYVANDTMRQKMLVLNNKLTNSSVELYTEVQNINKKKNDTVELNTKQAKLLDKLDTAIAKTEAAASGDEAKLADIKRQKDDLTALVKSATNVVYGSKNEGSGYDYFKAVKGIDIKKRQVAMKKLINSTVISSADAVSSSAKNGNKKYNIKYNWYLSGIADGETLNGELIEIKNRRSGLFKKVRDYEMCQIQSYLHITGRQKAYLVELITGADKTVSGFILDVDSEPQYFYNTIYPNINRAINFLTLILYPGCSNVDNAGSFNEDELDAIRMELIRGDPQKAIYNLVYC